MTGGAIWLDGVSCSFRVAHNEPQTRGNGGSDGEKLSVKDQSKYVVISCIDSVDCQLCHYVFESGENLTRKLIVYQSVAT